MRVLESVLIQHMHSKLLFNNFACATMTAEMQKHIYFQQFQVPEFRISDDGLCVLFLCRLKTIRAIWYNSDCWEHQLYDDDRLHTNISIYFFVIFFILVISSSG